ncbi:MAG: patatin-like phospholipase family protein [Ruminococcaceae bacterium]|nr:patatin-like phospholipase family protein [Oscillospiraceae bacterium]
MIFKKYGLVLAGGGGKGAYQIGAWKALREMRISFDAIAGVSIGSINGALIAAGDMNKAIEFWHNVSVKKGIRIENELVDPENLFSKKNWSILFKEFLKNGGFDASPAADYIKTYVDEDKVRKKKIPLGIVTVHLSQSATPLEIFVEDIPQGELVDYLLASSNIPLATNIGPEGERFLDGGVYDNTPVMTLKKRGYNKLIVIDISNIKGVAHNLNFNNSQVVYIRPYDLDDLGQSFDFSGPMIDRRIRLGYLDTRKAFGHLSGNIYYFTPEVFSQMVEQYGANAIYELEELAHKLKVEKITVYGKDEFISAVKIALEESKAGEEAAAAEEPAAEKPADGTFDWSDIKEKWNQLRGRGQRKDLEEFAEAIAVLDSVVM